MEENRMNMIRSLLFAIVLGSSLLAIGPAAAQTADPALAPETTMEGTIQKLEFEDSAIIFEGIRFHAAPDLVVEIRGSHGAFTMLKEGMKARITYRVVSPSFRQAVRIEQLPDNYTLEEV